MNRLLHTLCASGLIAALFAAGCATTGEPGDSAKPAEQDKSPRGARGARAAAKPNYNYPSLSMEVSSRLLHDVVRKIGEEAGGGLVLMDGIAERQTPDLTFRNDSYGKVVEELASSTSNKWTQFSGYYFIYPEGYEQLLDLSLEGMLDPRYANEVIGFSAGANQRLYNVFNLLGHSLGLTIVADNFIADARCGEITLHEVPLMTALEAVLRSARIPQDQLAVVSTPDYIFLGTPRTANRGSLVEDQGAPYLENRVSLYLPRKPATDEAMPFYYEYATLGRLRGTIAAQLGIPVEIAPPLEKLPVNPCAMNNLTMLDTVNLLLWQWPVGEIRCVASSAGITLVPRDPPPAPEPAATE